MSAPPDTKAPRKAVAFCWQSKAALRMIREQVPEYGTAIGVYVALSVVASDKERNEFQTTHEWLATLSGFSIATIKRRLAELARIGLVKIVTPPMKAPSHYHLLPIGHKELTIAHREPAIAHETPLAVSYIRRTEEKKRGMEAAPVVKPTRPLTVPHRIGLEKKREILKGRLDTLRGETSEQWQRDSSPELVAQKRQAEQELRDVENQLLNA